MRNVGKGRTAASVVLVGLDNEDMGQVREALAAEAVLPSASVSFGDAIEVVRRGRPDVVIIGISQAREGALALAQALLKEVPGTALVALADRSDADAILAALRSGYKEYVVLPDDANRLRQAVHEAAFAPSEGGEQGLVVAMVGAKGGVGCTLLCTNLAAELAGIHRVICIDLDFSEGDVASMLDVTPKDPITDLLPRADRVDERMLTGSVAVHKSKLHVLAQPNELDRIQEVRADDVYAIIHAAAKGYQFALLDCGSHWDEAVAISLSVADLVVIVTTPDVVSVRDAYRRIKLFESQGLERDRIRLVVNRYSKTAFVKNADIETNLQVKVVATVANDPATVDIAINEGKLIRTVNKKSDAARDISTLVAVLTEGGEPQAPPEEPASSGGFFSRIFSRG